MIRTTLGIFAFAVALAASAQAAPLAPIQQPDSSIVTVREDCGPGMRRTEGGVCVRTATRRAVTRCAVGMRLVGDRCVR
jgi:hypothetical protein